MTYAIAVVEWQDASMLATSHWQDGDTPDLPDNEKALVLSTGYVMHHTKEWVVLAQTLGAGVHANIINVPTGMIKSFIQLTEATNGTS